MSGIQKIIKFTLKDINRYWKATDFMNNNNLFIGYSASARISEAIKLFPGLYDTKKDGSFRLIKVNEKYLEEHKKEILEYIKED